MSFSDDNERQVAAYAGGRKFESWKDWSIFAAMYYLPPTDADPTIHPIDGFNLQEGCTYYNTVSDEVRIYDGASWVPRSEFIGLSDTPGAFTGAALQVLRVNAGETAVEFHLLDYNDLANLPTEFPPGDHTHVMADLPATVVQSNVAEIITASWAFEAGATIGISGYNIIPPGGTAGQVLAKVNTENYRTEWADPPSGTFDTAFAYTITGAWDVNAAWNIQDLTVETALRMDSGGSQRFAMLWDADSFTLEDEGGLERFVAYDAAAVGGARLEIGDSGVGAPIFTFLDSDFSLSIDAAAANAGAKLKLLSDNSAADRETIIWQRNDGTEEMRIVMKTDHSIAIQANGASGWDDVMIFGQDYKPVVPPTGMDMRHADDAGSLRLPRIFVQAGSPDLADSEDGDLWFRPAV